MAGTAIIIGQSRLCQRVEQQLDQLPQRPVTLGWVVVDGAPGTPGAPGDSDHAPVLGTLDALEAIVAQRKPTVALVSLPAVMTDLVASTRTRLRRMGVPDRFFPTVEDQLAGVGPRSLIDVDIESLLDRPPRQISDDEIRRVVENRCVAITGAGGSIGSELARISARFNPQRLVLIERSENALFEIDRQIARFAPEVERVALLHDVVDSAATLDHFRRIRPSLVFHAAAHKHVPMMEDHPAAAIDNNLFGTKSVVDAADAAGVERFVMISTDKAVNPTSVMGATKRLAEMYVQVTNERSSTNFGLVRFGNVLGSTGSVLDIWTRQIHEGGPLTVTDAEMTRYFMTIGEAAALVVQTPALLDPQTEGGEVFVLDMGPPVRILDLVTRVADLYGLEAVPSPPETHGDTGSIRIMLTGARPGEKLHEELASASEPLLPTRHPDILIHRLQCPEPGFVEAIVEQLGPEQRTTDGQALAQIVHDAACCREAAVA